MLITIKDRPWLGMATIPTIKMVMKLGMVYNIIIFYQHNLINYIFVGFCPDPSFFLACFRHGTPCRMRKMNREIVGFSMGFVAIQTDSEKLQPFQQDFMGVYSLRMVAVLWTYKCMKEHRNPKMLGALVLSWFLTPLYIYIDHIGTIAVKPMLLELCSPA